MADVPGCKPAGRNLRALSLRGRSSGAPDSDMDVVNDRWLGLLTIDGPAGAGKSTVAHGVAALTGCAVLDVGVLYREVALRVLTGQRHGKDWEAAVTASLQGPMPATDERVEHRSTPVDELVATIASQPSVREVVTCWQRDWWAGQQAAIVVGRVGGLHVFAEADVKVYLTADEYVRRQRRDERGRDVGVRDAADATRKAQPMERSPDAVLIDTTALGPDEVIAEICQLLHPQRQGV